MSSVRAMCARTRDAPCTARVIQFIPETGNRPFQLIQYMRRSNRQTYTFAAYAHMRGSLAVRSVCNIVVKNTSEPNRTAEWESRDVLFQSLRMPARGTGAEANKWQSEGFFA